MVLFSSMQRPSSSQNTEKGPETEGSSTLRLNQNGPQYTHKVEILHMEETKHHESENKWHEEDIRIINPKEKQDNYCLQNNNRNQRIGMKKRSESSFRENKIPNCRNEGKQEVRGNLRTWNKKVEIGIYCWHKTKLKLTTQQNLKTSSKRE